MTSTLITANKVLTLEPRNELITEGYLVLEGNRITEIGKIRSTRLQACDQHIDLSNRLLMPGLVNAHTHTPMVLFRGQAEGVSLFTMEGFLQVLRVLEAAADENMVAAAVQISCAEMIRTGTTCFADQYFYMDKIVPEVKGSGMRAALAYGIVELGDEAARRREIESATAFLSELQGDPLLTPWVGPHAFFVDNSLQAIQEELELAERFKTGFHIHFATTSEEEDYCQEHFGRSAVQQMKILGILDHPVLAAHSISIPESDMETLAETPFTAVICPSAALRSGTGAASLVAMRSAGVNTALGTDNVANANSYDLFNEMQIAAKLMAFKERMPAAVPARDIVEMATLGGARALGMEDHIGSIQVGKRADLIALDLDGIGWGPLGGQDLYTALVYAISGHHVTDVMVDGNWLYQGGEWTTLDYPAARKQLEHDFHRLQRRLRAG
jgi:5-methylthioadenosine/S-adenosylhomocysteine deaminase